MNNFAHVNRNLIKVSKNVDFCDEIYIKLLKKLFTIATKCDINRLFYLVHIVAKNFKNQKF